MKNVQAFLGFANFYCQFIPKFLKKVKPLNELIKDTQYTTRKGTKKSSIKFSNRTTCVNKPSRI